MAAFDFPLSPTTGMMYAAPGGSPVYVYDGSTWRTAGYTGGVPSAGYRNAVINGNFDIIQRNFSGAAATGYRYTADRWAVDAVGSTVAPSLAAFPLGQGIVPNEPKYAHSATVVSVAGATNYATLTTRIEGVRTFAGQVCTLSWWAWADAARPMAVDVLQFFGSGGSPSANVTGIGTTKVNLTNVYRQYTSTFTMPSIAGKTLGSSGNDFIMPTFWFDAGSSFNARTNSLGQQSGTFGIAQVQLELGAVATPFERRPFGIELEMCQRYYEAGRTNCCLPAPAAGGYAASFPNSFRVSKGGAPTMVRNLSGGSANFVSVNPYGPSTESDWFFVLSNAAGNCQVQVDWTASWEI